MKPELFKLSPPQAVTLLNRDISVKEIHFTQVDGKPYYLAYQDDNHTRMMSANGDPAKPFEKFNYQPFLSMVQRLNPGIVVLESTLLNEYDNYYYSRHDEKHLPVLRVKMQTPQQTWYYVDLKTGQVALKHEKLSRLERWLYHGLHSFDFKWLFYKRPLWDILVGMLMIGGMSVSCTGLVLTWKWARRRLKYRSEESVTLGEKKI